jgi:hypothetical protein
MDCIVKAVTLGPKLSRIVGSCSYFREPIASIVQNKSGE